MEPVGKVTLQTIADTVGVSRMTVSNAFSRPDQLSQALRDKILAVAAELGYAGPDPAARGLATGTAGAIGILLTDSLAYAFADEVAAGFVGAIAADVAPAGLALTLLTTHGTTDRLPARDVPLDGALVYSCRESAESVEWLVRRQLPLVFVDQTPVPGYDSVNIDDRGGARLAAEHVTELGHRRVGIVTSMTGGPVGVQADPVAAAHKAVAHERVIGWLEGLAAAGVEPVVVQVDGFDATAGRHGAELLLAQQPRPTAVLCISDVIASEVIQAARRLGLDVPGDLSVVGFDDAPLASRVTPALTTIRQDVAAKGHAAMAALLEQIGASTAERDRRPVSRVVLPVELVVRESTAAPR
jgi:DNA-binding LacI/PurR family transcriptional regulator